jgi:hypothetical protein
VGIYWLEVLFTEGIDGKGFTLKKKMYLPEPGVSGSHL